MSETLASILGTSLYALAAAAVLWAFLGQRIIVRVKRLRRCPKCLYDMSGTESMTCSECGKRAKRERLLHRGRTRKRWVLLALLALPGAHVTGRIPQIEDRGWVAAAPTTALILSLPWLEPDLEWVVWRQELQTPSRQLSLADHVRRADSQLLAQVTAKYSSTSGPISTWREQLYAELVENRLESEDRLWEWQRSILVSICNLQSQDEEPGNRTWDSLGTHVLGTTRWADGRRLNWYVPPEVAGVGVSLHGRTAWPVGTPVFMRRAVDWPEPKSRYYARVVVSGATSGSVGWSEEWTWYPSVHTQWDSFGGDVPWSDDQTYIGTFDSEASSLVYDLTVSVAEEAVALDLYRWTIADRKTVSAPVQISGSIESMLTGASSDAFATRLQSLQPSLVCTDPAANDYLAGRAGFRQRLPQGAPAGVQSGHRIDAEIAAYADSAARTFSASEVLAAR